MTQIGDPCDDKRKRKKKKGKVLSELEINSRHHATVTAVAE